MRACKFLAFAVLAFLTVPAAAQDRGNLTWSAIYGGQVRQEGSRAPLTAPVPVPRADTVHALIRKTAARHGLPGDFALRIAKIESGYRCNAIGRAGEKGLFQVKPATARGIGYRGPASALRTCATGAEWGVRHLAIAYRRCGTLAGAARLHNRGLAASCHGGGRYVSLAMRRT